MAALLLQEPRVNGQSRSARPNRATLRKQPDEGSMRFCSCLRSRMTLTRAPDERSGAEAFEDIDQHDLAAVSGNDLVADHLLAGVIAALDQHTWLDLRNQIERRVFFTDDDEIDRLQRRQHFRPRALVLNRTPLALQPLHRGIAVQADNQAITGAARRGQNLNVAGMQNIEAPVGESDSQSLFAPIQKMRVEVAACRDNLFFSREESMRQNFPPQFR